MSSEYVYFSQGKIFKTRAVQRVPIERRWSTEALQEVRVAPHALYQRPEPGVLFKKDPSVEVQQRVEDKHVVVRDMNLRKQDFEGPGGHGYTEDGCRRCRWAIDHGWAAPTALSHSAECRARLREAIRASGEAGRLRVEAFERRRDQWLAKKVEDAPAEGEQEEPATAAERPAVDPPFVCSEDLDGQGTVDGEDLYGERDLVEEDVRGGVATPRAEGQESYPPTSPMDSEREE